MIKIGICDDNDVILDECQSHIKKVSKELKYDLQIFRFHSAEEFLFEVSDNLNSYDIIYMDMIMQEMTGLDAIRKIRELGYKNIVIFLTSSKEYAIEAYDVSPFGYILKGDYSDKFIELLKKAISIIETSNLGNIVMNRNKEVVSIPLNHISYIESYLRKVIFHLKDEDMMFYARLSDIETELCTKGFVRCHKSYIVNIKAMKSFNSQVIVLHNQQEIPMGEKYYTAVKNIFFDQFMMV